MLSAGILVRWTFTTVVLNFHLSLYFLKTYGKNSWTTVLERFFPIVWHVTQWAFFNGAKIDASGNKENSVTDSLSLAVVPPKFYAIFFCLCNCCKQSYIIRFGRMRRKRNISAVSTLFSLLFCGFPFFVFNVYTLLLCGKKIIWGWKHFFCASFLLKPDCMLQ